MDQLRLAVRQESANALPRSSYSEGEAVRYRCRDGRARSASIHAVHSDMEPATYTIKFDDDGAETQTVRERLSVPTVIPDSEMAPTLLSPDASSEEADLFNLELRLVVVTADVGDYYDRRYTSLLSPVAHMPTHVRPQPT